MQPSAAIRSALDAAEGAVVLLDGSAEGRVVWANEAFARAAGVRRDDAVGRSLAALPTAGVVPLVLRLAGAETADEEAWRVFAASSRDIVSRIDTRGICTYASPSCLEILGYRPEELVGQRGLEHIHPDDRALAAGLLADGIARGDARGAPIVARARHKDGTYVWLEFTAREVRDAAGKIVAFQSSARDVTARVRAEEALERSHALFRELLEQLPEAACVHREGTFLYVNPEFASFVGRQADDLVGTRVLDLVHRADRSRVEHRLGPQRDYRRSFEHVLVRSDGSELAVEVAALPVVWGDALADLSIVRDLSTRRRLEAQLTISERLASVGRLAAAVGHEVKNPLVYLLGNLELLREDVESASRTAPALAASMREHLATVREAAERVRDIVNDLRTLSVAPSGREGPVALHRALDAAIASAEHELAGRARLVKDYAADVGAVLGEERRLVQVFVNLLVNAAHAIPPGDRAGNEVRIRTRRDGDAAVVEIEDTGCGLPDDAARIFEPFYTTKPSGLGTGLGLAVSHQIVTSFGGSISAERLAARGSVFRVRLNASSAEPPPVKARDDAPSSPARRILLVDDEVHVRTTLARLLAPHEVVVAAGAREAIDILSRDVGFDAIVCDLHMQDGSGADVYACLAEKAPHLQGRVVFMTGGAYTDEAERFLATSARPCLEKPFMPAELLEVLAKTIGA
jgi:PAS domain S-box-containing protein